jgi:uncharacterized membrane protein YjfL (UPF0719 family)
VGIGLVLLLSANVGAVLPMVIFFAVAALITVKHPYREKCHNNRQIANMSIIVAVECIYLAFQFNIQNTSPIFLYLPLAVCCLLIICVAYNGVAIVYGTSQFIR